MTPKQRQLRNRLLKKVHIGRRDLGFDDSAYRGMLAARYGEDSAGDLSIDQLIDLVHHFEVLGVRFTTKPSAQKRGRTPAEFPRDPQAKKIRAMWLDLHNKGIVRDPSESALNKFVKRHTKVEQMAWLDAAQASAVIEALKAWRDRDEQQTRR